MNLPSDNKSRSRGLRAGVNLYLVVNLSLLVVQSILVKRWLATNSSERSKERAYRIGRRTFELARVAERNIDLVTLVRPVMLRLVWQLRESLSLAVPASSNCVVVSTIQYFARYGHLFFAAARASPSG